MGSLLQFRNALAMTLRPISVIVGLAAGGIVTAVLRYGVFTVVWFTDLPSDGSAIWALSLIVVAAGESTGGYVAARLSRARGLAAAVAVGAVGLLLGITSLLLRPSAWWDWWLSALYLALGMLAAVAGGCFALRRRGEGNAGEDESGVEHRSDAALKATSDKRTNPSR